MQFKTRFFKLPSHSRFDYAPRYYDERKEQLEERIKRIKTEEGIGGDDQKIERSEMLRSKMNSEWKGSKRSKQLAMYNLRLFIILIVLGLAFLWVYSNLDVGLEKLINK